MRCVSYLRISKEERLLREETVSIENQRLLIEQFLREKDWKLAGEYVDDGYSGSNFERPAVQNLFSAVRRGELDCILVKDLSRFGRNYLESGRYIQQIFPMLNVRFIAISDGYDSASCDFFERNLMLPVLNLMNDAYCRDISRKVRWQQTAKRKAGEFIGAFAVYGYVRDENAAGRLRIDTEAAEVVRRIFRLRLSGLSGEKIAMLLNEEGVLSPYAYKKKKNSRFCSSFAKSEHTPWSAVAVRRILHNEIYIGVLEQGKEKKISYRLPDRKKLPRQDWIRVEDAVEPIVTKQEFAEANRALKRGRRKKGG